MDARAKHAPVTPLIERVEVVSRPDAKIIVKRLRLTEAGRQALTTGSAGIETGASLQGWRSGKLRSLQAA